MKKLIFCSLFALVLGVNVQAQPSAGVQFVEETFEKALAQAGKEKKILFVDAYATWCGPCKAMSRNVFPNKEVGDYYNANFVSVKIDWESRVGNRLQGKYPIRAYPSLLFIAADGKLLHRAEGYYDAQELVTLGKSVVEKNE
jgi:thiol:disulfide interchange protein